jgi:hypothetical protein
MARLPRYGLPGQPQHVIQRGNNRSPIFFAAEDYAFFNQSCLTPLIFAGQRARDSVLWPPAEGVG